MMLAFALTRVDVANYLSALFTVYIVLILLYILLNLLFSVGFQPPYSRASDAVLAFLREVCEPYLRLFRRLLPPIGMFDITPMLALIVLYVLQRILVGLIQG